MKKYCAYVLAFLLIFLNSCSERTKVQKNIDLDTAVNKEYVQSSVQNDEEYKVRYIIERSEDNHISIAVPVMDSEITNEVIYNFIDEYFKHLGLPEFDTVYSESDIDTNETEYYEYLIDIDCKVMDSHDEIVSIMFEGFLNHKSAAHPINLFTALNLNVDTNKQVFFKDKFSLNRDTYNVFAEYAKKDLKQAINEEHIGLVDSFGEKICSYESFIEGMKTENDFHTYFTEDAVGISYPVSHSMGDYIVVEIPYNDISI